jgi:hypothetical protein
MSVRLHIRVTYVNLSKTFALKMIKLTPRQNHLYNLLACSWELVESIDKYISKMVSLKER